MAQIRMVDGWWEQQRELRSWFKERGFLGLPPLGDWRLYRHGGRPGVLFLLMTEPGEPAGRKYDGALLAAAGEVATRTAWSRGGVLIAVRKRPGPEIRPEPSSALLRLYGLLPGQGVLCRLEPAPAAEIELNLPAVGQLLVEYRSSGGHAAPWPRRGNTVDALRGLAEALPELRADYPGVRVTLTVPRGGTAANTIPALVQARLWLEGPAADAVEGMSAGLRRRAVAEGRARECEVRVHASPVSSPVTSDPGLARAFLGHRASFQPAARHLEPPGPATGEGAGKAPWRQLALRVPEEELAPATRALARTVSEVIAP